MKIAPSLFALALAGALAVAGCGNDPANDPVDESQQTPSGQPGNAPVSDGASMPPWAAPTDVPARVAAAGLDLGPMGMAEHYHPLLRTVINGVEITLPANIGVDPSTGAMSAVHTHEEDGTIHIEADKSGEVFTLGQLFTQWGVKLTPTQIGGVQAKPGQKVTLTSDGTPVAGDPMDLRLKPEQEIELRLR
ncbi:MAG: hypothetical protein ABIR34_08895 [Marmoricola sp.]